MGRALRDEKDTEVQNETSFKISTSPEKPWLCSERLIRTHESTQGMVPDESLSLPFSLDYNFYRA